MKTTLQSQWHEMINQGIDPSIEYHVGTNHTVIVDLYLKKYGLQFSFYDSDLNSDLNVINFPSDLKKLSENTYFLPVNRSMTDLIHYIKKIDTIFTNSYLLQNKLISI